MSKSPVNSPTMSPQPSSIMFSMSPSSFNTNSDPLTTPCQFPQFFSMSFNQMTPFSLGPAMMISQLPQTSSLQQDQIMLDTSADSILKTNSSLSQDEKTLAGDESGECDCFKKKRKLSNESSTEIMNSQQSTQDKSIGKRKRKFWEKLIQRNESEERYDDNNYNNSKINQVQTTQQETIQLQQQDSCFSQIRQNQKHQKIDSNMSKAGFRSLKESEKSRCNMNYQDFQQNLSDWKFVQLQNNPSKNKKKKNPLDKLRRDLSKLVRADDKE